MSTRERPPSIAHGINPVAAPEGSAFWNVQQVTFRSMVEARAFAAGAVDVDILTAQYPEDRPLIPSGFRATPDLDRSVLDIGSFAAERKLPLLGDILDRVCRGSTADLIVFTNADIALQPHFYAAASRIADAGHDAFVVNRRTLPESFRTVDELPLMYGQIGEDHPGYDCFVFRRSLYESFDLGGVCVGSAWVGRCLLANLAVLASNFTELRRAHLTFHIGDDVAWRDERYADYLSYNHREYLAAYDRLEKAHGPFRPKMRSYLLDTAGSRAIPSFPSPLAEGG